VIELNDELALEYLAECSDHLSNVEADLLAVLEGRAQLEGEFLNRVFRSIHSVKGGAGFFDLVKIRELAHAAEDVLALIRARTIPPTRDCIQGLLHACDKLIEMTQNAGSSNRADIAGLVAELKRAHEKAGGAPTESARPVRILLVEDDFASRLVLQAFLSRYGDCHIAVNGKEAVDAFRAAVERGEPYDMICMDIMMPEMDGREAVRQIRALEEANAILSTAGAKIIMTTTVEDVKEVIRCFMELCDAYLTKPIDLSRLLSYMQSYGLVR
jgi:two-component system chemotaxis response regulator CheY